VIHAERIPEYLQHMIVACNRAMLFTRNLTEATFKTDLMAHEATVRSLHILGEAANRIRIQDPDFIKRHGLGTFTLAIGMRNRLAHEYEDVDLEVTWDTVISGVPALREKIIQVLYELGIHPDLDSLHF
jgi:uncharacterized protein with HEPN domain